MTSRVEARLAELGLTLPAAAAPVANYVPWVLSGRLLFVSGQLPMRDGRVAVTGKLGAGLDIAQGQEAARLCALMILAQARSATGDLDRIVRCVELGGFVACTPDFTDHPRVVNGASDLMVEVLGDAGRHSRFAVGVPSLPLDAAVEIRATFEIA
jgi:enamine deaminase RidA (YjgF/YER057c/UK114 family)